MSVYRMVDEIQLKDVDILISRQDDGGKVKIVVEYSDGNSEAIIFTTDYRSFKVKYRSDYAEPNYVIPSGLMMGRLLNYDNTLSVHQGAYESVQDRYENVHVYTVPDGDLKISNLVIADSDMGVIVFVSVIDPRGYVLSSSLKITTDETGSIEVPIYKMVIEE